MDSKGKDISYIMDITKWAELIDNNMYWVIQTVTTCGYRLH